MAAKLVANKNEGPIIMSSLANFIFAAALLLAFSGCGPKPDPKERFQELVEKGNSQYKQGQYRDAIKAYKKALKIENNNANVFSSLANAYEKLELPDSAMSYYEGAIVFNPRDIDAYQKIANINYQQKNLHEAMSWYDRAQDLGSLTPQSYSILGNIYYRWREFQRAEGYYNRALEIDSTFGEALYGNGLVDLAFGDTVASVASFGKALQNGSISKAAYMLGLIEYNLNHLDSAEGWLKDYLKRDPSGDLARKATELIHLITTKKHMAN
jgi:tetratricopeptide (TPR) repeat protein